MENSWLLELNDKEQIEVIDDILTRYTNDEVGLSGKDEYLKMNNKEKLYLFNNAIEMTYDEDDFDVCVVINFDYHAY